MRIRRVVITGLAAGLLAGCGGLKPENAPSAPPLVSVSTPPDSETPSQTPSATPSESAKAADTLCVRMNATLVRSTLAVPVATVQPKTPPADFGIPTYDVCQLELGIGPNPPVLNVETSVLPATKAILAATQKAYAATKGEPAKPAVVGEGGYGTSTFVVFLLGGKLYKIAGPKATPAKYVEIARDVALQQPGQLVPEWRITRPECDRGSAAAEKVMGAAAMIRRDGQTLSGDPVCGWVNSASVLYSTVRRTPNAKALMAPIRTAATAQSVPLGDEGYVDTATGRTTIRVGDDKLVDLVPLPARAINPDLMTQFALAMSPLYTR
ncbi:hypothetical protein [Kribbella solani]|uniref:Uncharacterized protein n=1 Tax=Kribbella solani TaxID=236067 RepID=A0A841DRR3_9ACTN|nr:hypothetical protein [Kribbella solani]MBB5981323.1 hypothetical protein [Kribbella solani]